MRQYSARMEDLSGIERLAALENERMIRRESQPGAGDNLARLGVGVTNSIMNWRKGGRILKAQKDKQDTADRMDLIQKGFTEYDPKIAGTEKPIEAAGKLWRAPQSAEMAAKGFKQVNGEWVRDYSLVPEKIDKTNTRRIVNDQGFIYEDTGTGYNPVMITDAGGKQTHAKQHIPEGPNPFRDEYNAIKDRITGERWQVTAGPDGQPLKDINGNIVYKENKSYRAGLTRLKKQYAHNPYIQARIGAVEAFNSPNQLQKDEAGGATVPPKPTVEKYDGTDWVWNKDRQQWE